MVVLRYCSQVDCGSGCGCSTCGTVLGFVGLTLCNRLRVFPASPVLPGIAVAALNHAAAGLRRMAFKLIPDRNGTRGENQGSRGRSPRGGNSDSPLGLAGFIPLYSSFITFAQGFTLAWRLDKQMPGKIV